MERAKRPKTPLHIEPPSQPTISEEAQPTITRLKLSATTNNIQKLCKKEEMLKKSAVLSCGVVVSADTEASSFYSHFGKIPHATVLGAKVAEPCCQPCSEVNFFGNFSRPWNQFDGCRILVWEYDCHSLGCATQSQKTKTSVTLFTSNSL